MSKSKPLLIAIHGTWGLDDKWCLKGSNALKALEEHFEFPNHRFNWSGRMGGVFPTPDDPDNPWDDAGLATWWDAAEKLKYYMGYHGYDQRDDVHIVAHSHGGQVAIMSIAVFGVPCHTLITASTPPRRDLKQIRGKCAKLVRRWIHIRGDFWKDIWARLGRVGHGWRPWHAFWGLDMEEAHANVRATGHGHSTYLREADFLSGVIMG